MFCFESVVDISISDDCNTTVVCGIVLGGYGLGLSFKFMNNS